MIIIFFALLGVFLAYLFLNRQLKLNKSKTPNILIFIKAFGIIVAIFIFGIIQPFSIQKVDAGYVGIKVSLIGDKRGIGKYEYKTGWVIYNSWVSKLYEFPTYQQMIKYDKQQVITKGGFTAEIHPTFNYSLIAGSVGDMFSNLRLPIKQVEQGWLHTAITGSINDVANKWTVDDIFNKRELFEGDIAHEINKRISRWFIISQLRTNIIPPIALSKAIEEKTKALQDAQVAENQKLVAIAIGDKLVAEARADSASRVIRANGEAEEIKRKQVALNNLYLEYLKIQKWNGILPQVTTSASNSLLLNIDKK